MTTRLLDTGSITALLVQARLAKAGCRWSEATQCWVFPDGSFVTQEWLEDQVDKPTEPGPGIKESP